jgi:16S rRNA G966 N2-methylase RsmD
LAKAFKARSALFLYTSACVSILRFFKFALMTFTTQAEVYKNNADRALKALAKREIQFDVIFLDPPYEKNFAIPSNASSINPFS